MYKIFNIVFALGIIAIMNSCALDDMGSYQGNRPTTLVGFLDTAGTVLEDSSEDDTIIITYIFVIEDQNTMGICAKPSTSTDFDLLQSLPIYVELSEQFVSATQGAPAESTPIYPTNSSIVTVYALTNRTCPYDSTSYFVGYFDVEGATALPYVTVYIANNGKMALGSTMTPFYSEDRLSDL